VTPRLRRLAGRLTPFPRAAASGPSRRAPSSFWRIREDIPPRLRWILIAFSLGSPLLIWWLVYLSGQVSELFLPSPLDAWAAGVEWFRSGDLRADAWVSIRRVTVGYGIAVAISVPLGLAMGTFRSIQSLFEPAIAFIRYMPAPAFIPLFLIWFGIYEEPKIALIFMGTVFFNTLMTANVVWQVPSELIHVSRTLGANGFVVFRKVIFPHAVPGMIDAVRVNLAAAWNLIVVAELFAADQGLGFRIVRSQKFLQTDSIFAVLIAIGVIGVLSDVALRLLRDRLSPWAKEL
jgi:NitT/TauT family transport system permease protein